MNLFRVIGEDQADFAHAITHCHKCVKMLIPKHVEMFGACLVHIDAEALHNTLR